MDRRRPIGRRPLLVLGAAALLQGCATSTKLASPSAAAKSTPPTGAANPSGSASGAPWQPPVPAKPTPGVCPTVPGIVQKAGGPQYYLPCQGTNIALTIDDGPDPQWTPQILALLARCRIQATFCMIGSHAQSHPDLVAMVADKGHHIANHTFTHPLPFTQLSPSQIAAEINRASDVLTTASGGHRPTLFRAPGGEWSAAALRACAAAGMRPLDWSVDPRDWSMPGTSHIVDVILTKTHPGSIILEHDGNGNRQQTVDALTIALPRLIDAGYQFTQP